MSTPNRPPPQKLGPKGGQQQQQQQTPAQTKEADTEPPSDEEPEPEPQPNQSALQRQQDKERTVAQKPRQTDNSQPQPQAGNPSQLALQNQALMQQIEILKAQTASPAPGGQRISAVRQSRIVDRQDRKPASDSSVKINIELDLEVEVDLYARVKGDVTIGLM